LSNRDFLERETGRIKRQQAQENALLKGGKKTRKKDAAGVQDRLYSTGHPGK